MIKKNSVVIYLLCLLSCQNFHQETDSSKIIKLIQAGTDSTIKREYNSKGEICKIEIKYFDALYVVNIIYKKDNVQKIFGNLMDSLYGHYFEFFENGQLKKYCFYYGNSKYHSFIREYSKDRQIMKSNGDAFVDYMQVNDDSIDLFFSNVIYDSIRVFLSDEGRNEVPVLLRKSNLSPMLFQNTIPVSKTVLIRINAFDRNTGYRQNYYDTLNFGENCNVSH